MKRTREREAPVTRSTRASPLFSSVARPFTREVSLLDIPSSLLEMELLAWLDDDVVALGRLAQTCHYFSQTAFSCVRRYELKARADASAILDRMPNLTSLRVCWPREFARDSQKGTTWNMLTSISKLGKLKVLDLSQAVVFITDSILRALPNLEELRLPNNLFVKDFSNKALASLTKLRVLTGCIARSKEEASVLGDLTLLEELTFEYASQLNGSDLVSMTRLRKLVLFSVQLTAPLSLPPSLHELCLPAFAGRYPPSLRNLPLLERLHLGGMAADYTDADLMALPRLRSVCYYPDWDPFSLDAFNDVRNQHLRPPNISKAVWAQFDHGNVYFY